jgi:dihydrofolate synthase/folylpolyglutamate synthase
MSDNGLYAATLEYLYGLNRFGIEPGLDRIRALLNFLGDPHDQLDVVHVGGTNGKGSTSAIIERLLREAGHTTGLFTSPHLQSFRERIRHCGRPISEEAVAEGIALLRQAAERRVATGGDHPIFFEFVTALMYWYLHRKNTDMVVQEVGLGGTYDATNVVETSLVTVLTMVDLDHTNVLGNSVGVIARDKAGIMRRRVPVVTGFSQPEAQEALAERAVELETPVFYVRDRAGKPWRPNKQGLQLSEVTYSNVQVNSTGVSFDLEGSRDGEIPQIRGLRLPMLGKHQAQNAAVAAAAAQLACREGSSMCLQPQHIMEGMADVSWPGRLEQVAEAPAVYLDGAHNRKAAEALSEALSFIREQLAPLTLVFGVLNDKPWKDMLDCLLPHFERIVVTTADSPRSEDPTAIQRWVGRSHSSLEAVVVEDPTEAVERAVADTPPTGAVCVIGSLYLVGRVRRKWFPEASD